MALNLAADLALMFKDAPGSVAVKYNGASTWGILDRGDGLQGTDGGMMQIRTTTLRIATGSITGLRDAGRITCDDEPFKISAFDKDGDGLETVLMLVEAS